jgi:hypothetical protein
MWYRLLWWLSALIVIIVTTIRIIPIMVGIPMLTGGEGCAVCLEATLQTSADRSEMFADAAASPPRLANRSEERRAVGHIRVVMVVLTAAVLGIAGIARALECEGRLVSMGDTPWQVHAICGAPAEVGDSIEVILKPVYHPSGHVAGHVPVAVLKSVWTYNFGSTRLIYVLTFLEDKLVKIETGGYGH